jgi:glycosyltransferase involved in cell wall biosynthesis
MIVIDATPLQTGHRHHGIGSYTAGLLNALLCPSLIGSHGDAPALLLHASGRGDPPLAVDVAVRPDIRVIPVSQPLWQGGRWPWLVDRVQPPMRFRCIRAAVQRAHARIYHATEPNGLVRVAGVRTLATLYDLIPLHYPSAIFPLRRLDVRAAYARYLRQLRHADHLMAISEATKQDAVERLHIPPERISVTPLAVDDRRFYPRSLEEIGNVLARHNLRQPYFLHVGSSVYHKNTAAVVRAFSLFCQEARAEHALYVTGAYEDRVLADLHRSCRHLFESRRVRMIGVVPGDDLPALYSAAEALVYPSLIEGFGLPVLEAMRCATPVLTSNTSSLPEVGGDAVLYVDPRRPDEIAAGLHRLASRPALRAELVARGRGRAGLYSWARTAEQTLRVYKGFL